MTFTIDPGDALDAIDALRSRDAPWTDQQVSCLIAIAFESGRELGHEEGYERCNAGLVGALTFAIGGPRATDYGDAVQRLHRALDRKAAREAFDAETREAAA